MKNKKILLILSFVIIAIAFITYYIYTKEDKLTTLNLIERNWVEKNKNNVLDMGVTSNIPVFTKDGEGIVFDFLEDLKKTTDLSFNYVPFNFNVEEEPAYSFKIVDKTTENDILLFKDTYALISKKDISYSTLNEINTLKIGVLNDDLDKVNLYLNNNTVLFKTFENFDSLFEGILGENAVDMIAVPKSLYLDKIISEDFYINYNISEYSKNFIFTLGEDKNLNNILIKYYDKWEKENFDKSYDKFFSSNYFSSKKINDKNRSSLLAKEYKYGYVNTAPYDYLVGNKDYGVNIDLLKKFANSNELSVKFVNYKKYEDLKTAIDKKQVDFASIYSGKLSNSSSLYSRNLVVLSTRENDIVLNSVNSLFNNEVFTLNSGYEKEYLKGKNISITAFDNIYDLINKAHKNTLIVIDSKTYDFYKFNKLKKYKIDYLFKLDNYRYSFAKNEDNELFEDFLNFYISYNTNKTNYAASISNLSTAYGNIGVKTTLYLIVAFILSISLISSIIKFSSLKKKVKTKTITKEDKLKYIDMLTSLKNRNYLNDSLEKWDNSEIYPQSILVVDLNNVAYVNDNYGHAEGDNLIREAANILIMTQESGSDIVRTSGNEFLIYLVGHDEKSVVAYKRKLAKEFKELSHGFGAAIGYSMILDGIKTIDDAINEATLDMRNNKENL